MIWISMVAARPTSARENRRLLTEGLPIKGYGFRELMMRAVWREPVSGSQ
jgi:hypothetical protein